MGQYITSGKNRELLFGRLSETGITPWTPLKVVRMARADHPGSFRTRIAPLFPGYFFLKLNFEHHPISVVKQHSAFIGFVKFGGSIQPVPEKVVEQLMKHHPDPSLNPAAADELQAASRIALTHAQYQKLRAMEVAPHPMSRIAMLMEMISVT